MYEILDCTFRDGGYYTDWDFTESLFKDYLETVSKLPIKYIEIGYRNPTTDDYKGRFFYLNKKDLLFAKSKLNINQRLGIMLDVKNLNEENIKGLLYDIAEDVDFVRLATSLSNLESALNFGKEIYELGINVWINIMYLSEWQRDAYEVGELFSNAQWVDRFCIVDSYGSCFPENVYEIVRTIKENYSGKVGFHGHNNLELAFANTLKAIEAGIDSVDSTFLGMGRGAGNLKTELILVHLSQQQKINLDYFKMNSFIQKMDLLYMQYRWGISLPYIYSGILGLKQGAVMDWLIKDRVEPSIVIEALNDQDYKDANVFPLKLSEKSKTAIIIGGGEYSGKVSEFLKDLKQDNNIFIISSLKNIEHYSDILNSSYVVLTGHEKQKISAEELQFLDENILGWVINSGPKLSGSLPCSGKISEVEANDYFDILKVGKYSIPSPLQLAIAVSISMGVGNIWLVGFDGYPGINDSERSKNEENIKTLRTYQKLENVPKLVSLTPTAYEVPVISIFKILQTLR